MYMIACLSICKRLPLKGLAFLLSVFPTLLWAQTPAVGESVLEPSSYFVQIFVSLILVLLIIFFSAWMLRRFGRIPGVANGNLKVLGALSVGQRERILLLQVGKEQILVGVTSSRISTLHELQEPVILDGNETPVTGAFAQKLQAALARQSGGAKAQSSSD